MTSEANPEGGKDAFTRERQLQAHQNDMAAQREKFQKFWELFEPRLAFPHNRGHEKMALQHKAWQLWRELKEGE